MNTFVILKSLLVLSIWLLIFFMRLWIENARYSLSISFTIFELFIFDSSEKLRKKYNENEGPKMKKKLNWFNYILSYWSPIQFVGTTETLNRLEWYIYAWYDNEYLCFSFFLHVFNKNSCFYFFDKFKIQNSLFKISKNVKQTFGS